MNRTASAHWTGNLKEGRGTISSQSGVLKDTQYSFKTRFDNGAGTNPEELIAAAHAGCFTMALSSELGKAGMTADSLDTTATVTLDMLPTGPTISAIHLDVKAKIPGADAQKFSDVANTAKTNCPVSRVLNAKISMDAKLVAATGD